MSRKNSLAKLWPLGILVCGISLLGCSENNSNQTISSSDSSMAPKLSADLVYNEASMQPGDSGNQNKAILTFIDTIYHFGPIQEGEIVSHDFEFTNTGKSDLIIGDAKGSCGCTVPKYPTEPIKPGKTGKIDVEFNSAGKHGSQRKTITLITNAEPSTRVLAIKGQVTPINQK